MSFDSFATLNIAILVLALGKWLTRRFSILQEFNVPEPVTGGLIVCAVTAIIHAIGGPEIGFTLTTRDFLLLYFFAAIGLNSDFATLRAGGRPLAILVVATLVFMILQNLTGVAVASLMGLDRVVGLLGGSVSLLGGHGTTIAWAPVFAEEHGITNASEIGIACATVGLVLASLMGGPIARLLITRHRLEPAASADLDVGVKHQTKVEEIDYFGFLRTLFWLNISLALGGVIQQLLARIDFNLPLFVCSLFGAIILTNTVPRFTKLPWPARSRALALVSDVSLGVFLAMSLMSLQLWTIAALAGPILAMLAAQFVLAFCFALFVIFRVLGSDYEAAVVSAGFGGISLGATPTAMANMTAVAQKYGAAHKAFIIVPLVSGFFVDICNALVIQKFLNWLG
ncbi:MAG: sodium/glutamate symporter [Terrimicrobiaceae bacterium]|nr:sodium/glutamate symporter [Terrimicrobiaceae bacterium]